MAKAQKEAPVRKKIDRCRVFGEPQSVVEVGEQDSCADPQGRRTRRDRAE
jgi:hypothetical protein